MKRWMVTFAGSCTACVVVVLAALWAMNGFHGLGIGLQGTVALVLGIVFTVGLGIGLMALVFASDRGTADDEAYRSTIKKR